MAKKLFCKACGEEMEEFDKAYELDSEIYCGDCLTPIDGVVGYAKEWEYDDYERWTDPDDVTEGHASLE